MVVLGGFVALSVLGFAGLALARGNQEFLFYIATMLVIIGSVLAIHRRVRFPMALLWMLAIWNLAHLAGGLVRVGDSVLYNWWVLGASGGGVRWDHLVHAYGFACATWACWVALSHASNGTLRASPGVAFGLVCMGSGLGALNEVVEFTATKVVSETNVGGYENTAWDLVSNLVGSTIAAGILMMRDRRRTTKGG